MTSRCNRRRPVTVHPLDVGRLDAVLSVMAGLDDATVVIVEPDGDDHATFGIRDLPPDSRCMGAGLFGMHAPAGAALVGLCFSGVGRPLPPATGPVLGDTDRHRVDVVVTAAGATHARIHDLDDGPLAPSTPPTGVVIDALHRMIGLPTPGEPPPLTDLVAGMWMAEILRLTGDGGPTSWAEVAAAHSGTGADAVAEPPPTATPTDLAARMQELVDEASWPDLHRAAAIGRMAAPELAAEEAAWMDSTMFARWTVDSFPTVAVVRAELRRRGASEALRGIDQVLELLDPSPWSANHDSRNDDGDDGTVEHLQAG